MDKTKQEKLAQAGWAVGSAEDFLELSPEEVAYIELKLALAQNLREVRQDNHLTQKELAHLIKSSQSRVAKMESGDPSVSLDLLIRSLFALGKTPRDLSLLLAQG
ncbi:MAG: XRE family transcriptional regulator [Ardenticatenaceae bacterium]|nr:XRE family transcriptional regulator [Ardenticatenaceae bacterium]